MSVTCRDLISFLDDYLSHELDEARAAAFERHLSECRACVAYLDSYRETIRMARATAPREEDLPRELVEAILAAFR